MNAVYGSLFHVIKDMNVHEAINLEMEDYTPQKVKHEEPVTKENLTEKLKKLKKQIEEEENRELLDNFMAGRAFF